MNILNVNVMATGVNRIQEGNNESANIMMVAGEVGVGSQLQTIIQGWPSVAYMWTDR